jgi:hypothetical protein
VVAFEDSEGALVEKISSLSEAKEPVELGERLPLVSRAKKSLSQPIFLKFVKMSTPSG